MEQEAIHLVSGGSAASMISAWVSGKPHQRVIPLEDNLSMGPLLRVDTPEGIAERSKWIKSLFKSIYATFAFDEIASGIGLPVLNDFGRMSGDLIVWCGPNADEQLMLRAVLARLSGQSIKVADVGSLGTEGRWPRAVAECRPDDLPRVLANAWSPSEIDISKLQREWTEQVSNTGSLRIYQEGSVTNVPEDYFDAAIFSAVPSEFGSAARAVGHFLGESQHVIGDAFINYRLRKLVEAGAVDALNADGPLLSMRVRRRT